MRDIDTKLLAMEKLRSIVDQANEAADKYGHDPQFVVRAFDRAQLVYGVWTDATQPRGVGIAILQGIELWEEARRRGGSTIFRTAHIRCRSRDEAQVCSIMWGDDRDLQHLFAEAEA